MPPEPLTDMQQSCVALHEWYSQLRAAGFGILAACAYMAASVVYGGGEQPPSAS